MVRRKEDKRCHRLAFFFLFVQKQPGNTEMMGYIFELFGEMIWLLTLL